MKILALDTATESCSVAVLNNDVVISDYVVSPRMHANLILPMISKLLAKANIKLKDLNYIAFGRGPGAFTGVRIAASVTQGLAFGINCKVVGISNLQALAQRAYQKYQAQQVLSCIDARMNEVYVGKFILNSNQEMQLQGVEQVMPPGQVTLKDNNWCGAGSGFASYAEQLPNCARKLADLLPHAEDILHLARFALKRGEEVSMFDALPVYLRNNVATPKQK